MTLLHAVGMLVLFFGLLTLELFIPSGGLLGVAAAAALIAAIVIGFMHSLETGATILVGAAVFVPIVISIGLRIWPSTPIGRRMLTLNPEADARREAELRAEREAIIGKKGFARSNLLPSGLIEIDGIRMDAISLGMAIDAGQVVEIVSVSAGKIHVRAIGSNQVDGAGRVAEARPAMPASLETPIESLESEDWK